VVLRLDSADSDFEDGFAGLIAQKRETSQNVDDIVRDIILAVKTRGDDALIEYSSRFDNIELSPQTLRVSEAEIEDAFNSTDGQVLDALRLAFDRIQSHHQRQKPVDDRYTDSIGVELGSRWTPVESVGLYVPGGSASYPSSVLMNAVPANVAGVGRIVMVVPSPNGKLNPLVLAAAHIAGINEIYRIGGAQAIAALAHGTETIAPVAKIVGPGNAYVAAAKRQVFGIVGIDMIAGPSEILIVADRDNDPDWIAADLLAQAEHDENAQSILITDSKELADNVERAVERQLATLSRSAIAGKSWQACGAIITLENLDGAAVLIDRLAPEHLQIVTNDPDAILAKIRNAGAVFLGRYTPEVIGDYVGGSNHVLPTARTARFTSGLSVLDFVKRTSILRLGPEQLAAIGPAAVTLAKAEGLDAHGRSVSIRLNS
jgi:histidinol dehydrogenase